MPINLIDDQAYLADSATTESPSLRFLTSRLVFHSLQLLKSAFDVFCHVPIALKAGFQFKH